MGRLTAACVLAAAALSWGGAAHGLEYRSLAAPARLYDAPSASARPVFVIAAGTPVEVVVSLDKWVKVRDPQGDLSWVERQHLSDKRTVIVTAPRAEVRREAAETAPVAFEAAKDVVLDLVEGAPLGWAKVRHRDGAEGFVRRNQIWGY